MILYLHGFRSSPLSTKAQMLAKAVADADTNHLWVCPQLPAGPQDAINLCHNLIKAGAESPGNAAAKPLVIVGSSLGGFYAAWLAQYYRAHAVLLNPVVQAARDLAGQVGEHTQYHSNEPFIFLPQYVSELASLQTGLPTDPDKLFLMACTGDEVLDWKEMARTYAGCASRIINGSDHGVSDFERWMPEVLNFISEASRAPDTL